MEKIELKCLSEEQLAEALRDLSEKPFRAKQIYQWMHQKLAVSPEEMTNLPKTLREQLSERFSYTVLEKVVMLASKDGSTQKYLFRLEDGNVIETVLMRYRHGNSVCISSQVGCRMGCSFCASAIGGKLRDLSSAEMLEQIYAVMRDTGERVSNVVVMGTGEPLDNYENLIRFIRMLTDEKGLHLSQRNLTVSTCGLPEPMRRLADEGLAITLALSLHAPNDELRRQLMPAARACTVARLMELCDLYFQKTGRRVSFEYSLIEGVNDRPKHARELAELLRGKNCHVNLIPVNPVKERDYRRSNVTNVLSFREILENGKINVTIRREMGSDIDAACGQLRRRYMKDSE